MQTALEKVEGVWSWQCHSNEQLIVRLHKSAQTDHKGHRRQTIGIVAVTFKCNIVAQTSYQYCLTDRSVWSQGSVHEWSQRPSIMKFTWTIKLIAVMFTNDQINHNDAHKQSKRLWQCSWMYLRLQQRLHRQVEKIVCARVLNWVNDQLSRDSQVVHYKAIYNMFAPPSYQHDMDDLDPNDSCTNKHLISLIMMMLENTNDWDVPLWCCLCKHTTNDLSWG